MPDLVSLVVTVPMCPPRHVSPNARVHWSVRSSSVSAYREAAGWAAREALGCCAYPFFVGDVEVEVTVRWSRGRRRVDVDNAVAMLKPALDGLTDARVWRDDRQIVSIALRQEHGVGGVGETVIVVRGAGVSCAA